MVQGLGRTCLSKTSMCAGWEVWLLVRSWGSCLVFVSRHTHAPCAGFPGQPCGLEPLPSWSWFFRSSLKLRSCRWSNSSSCSNGRWAQTLGFLPIVATQVCLFLQHLGRAANVPCRIGILAQALWVPFSQHCFHRLCLPRQVWWKWDPWVCTMPYTPPFLFQILLGPNTGLSGGMPGALPSLPGKI